MPFISFVFSTAATTMPYDFGLNMIRLECISGSTTFNVSKNNAVHLSEVLPSTPKEQPFQYGLGTTMQPSISWKRKLIGILPCVHSFTDDFPCHHRIPHYHRSPHLYHLVVCPCQHRCPLPLPSSSDPQSPSSPHLKPASYATPPPADPTNAHSSMVVIPYHAQCSQPLASWAPAWDHALAMFTCFCS